MTSEKTIMVVDTDGKERRSVCDILEKSGYETIAATGVEDCLRRFRKRRPDVVLLEVMMPGRAVREIVPKISKAKIIYFTAVRISKAEKKALLGDKNIVDFISKPYNPKDLLLSIRQATGARK